MDHSSHISHSVTRLWSFALATGRNSSYVGPNRSSTPERYTPRSTQLNPDEGTGTMSPLASPTRDLVNAVLFCEWDGGEIDVFAIDRVREGELADWTEALTDSGLFTDHSLAVIVDAWRHDPELLVDALLAGADEVSRRRLKVPRRSSLLPATLPERMVSFG